MFAELELIPFPTWNQNLENIFRYISWNNHNVDSYL